MYQTVLQIIEVSYLFWFPYGFCAMKSVWRVYIDGIFVDKYFFWFFSVFFRFFFIFVGFFSDRGKISVWPEIQVGRSEIQVYLCVQ